MQFTTSSTEHLFCGQEIGGELMTDRKMLELAAKAAGIRITGWDHQLAILDDGSFWQPLYNTLKTDCMGDALRLAVKLGLLYSPEFFHFLSLERFGNQDKDDCCAHRRAIVRAAAEISKAKKEGADE